jgi:hypothetical protein
MDWGNLVLAYLIVAVTFGVGFVAGAYWKASHSSEDAK